VVILVKSVVLGATFTQVYLSRPEVGGGALHPTPNFWLPRAAIQCRAQYN